MGIDEVVKFVADKLKETVPAMDNFGTELATANDWIQTSSEKIHTATPFLSAAFVLVVVVGICRCCCCGWGRMMRAPGGDGRRIRRQAFESNPKGYFANQRSHAD